MHEPVMLGEVVDLLQIVEGGRYLDGTAGNGGHSEAILARAGSGGALLALDQDRSAVERVRARLAGYGSRAQVVHANFSRMAEAAGQAGWTAVDGIVLDLGVSSEQLDTPERGFSFMKDGPLDMRMDTTGAATAADLVNALDEAELVQVLRTLGEEPQAGRIARAIVRARESERFTGTARLAEVVAAAAGGRHGRLHPATRTFQALRMAVNRELENLEAGLEAGLRLLKPGGRMAVIAFHSLEDRVVKTCWVRHAGRWESLPQGGEVWRGVLPAVVRVTRKVARPTDDEVARNPRARSARLRVVERLPGEPAREVGMGTRHGWERGARRMQRETA